MKARGKIKLPSTLIADFCRKRHIVKLSLFGSHLTGNAHPGSDLDLLVEFDSQHIPGFLTLAEMELELAELLGLKVDLRTADDLSRYFRQEVVENAEVQYVRS
ncbi:nucleotidyltransferase domain-containing protein [bacterium]|nr:nucleotidyltransferase domain-containing protein [bacterium]MBU1881043.1 nucleotidyltransferase domain-containing protein [bacterium]